MADNSLNQPVIVRAVSINASSIPAGYSPAYTQYILSQAIDFTNVAGKANEAGQGAYDAQVKNDEQDITLDDHETRIAALRVEVDDHEVRITTNSNNIAAIDVRVTSVEGSITTINADIAALETRLTTDETNIANLQSQALLKSGNLAGLSSVTASRANLGLGDSATKNTGTTAGTVAAGDDARLLTVNGKNGGNITSSITVSGSVSSTGYECRSGVSGSTLGNKFNIYWNGTTAELWIDTTKIGNINITP